MQDPKTAPKRQTYAVNPHPGMEDSTGPRPLVGLLARSAEKAEPLTLRAPNATCNNIKTRIITNYECLKNSKRGSWWRLLHPSLMVSSPGLAELSYR